MFAKLRSAARSFWAKTKNLARRIFTKSHAIQAGYFVGTVALSYLVLKATLPMWMALLVLGVVVVHELAHYVVALLNHRKPYLPFFVPLVYFIIGATRVRGREPVSDMKIAMAGPTASAVVCVGAMGVSAYVGHWPAFWVSFWLFVSQVYTATLGGDGRRYRRAKTALQTSDLANAAFI